MQFFKHWTHERIKNTVVAVLAAFIVVELVWAAAILFQEGRHEIVPILPASATLAMQPESMTVTGGKEFNVDVLLVTNGRQVQGVDAVIHYDPKVLKLQSSVASAAASATSSALFDEYPANDVDEEKGIITLSAIQRPGEIFNGSGVLGRLTFEAAARMTIALYPQPTAAPVQTTVSFSFQRDVKDDSNVVDTNGDDILGAVVNATVTVQ
ncbi:MAG: cohesin domain-containing protein [bacterium]|nr:cohesin domain-containing protein [bacterium]